MKKSSLPFYYAIAGIAVMSRCIEIYSYSHTFQLAGWYDKMVCFVDVEGGYNVISKYLPVIIRVLFIIFIYNHGDKFKSIKKFKKLIIYGMPWLFFILTAFARTAIMDGMLSAAYIYFYKNRQRLFGSLQKKIKTILAGCICIIAVLSVFSWIAVATNRAYSDLVFSKDFYLWRYFAWPLPAMDRLAVNYGGIRKAYRFLGPVSKVLNVFHLWNSSDLSIGIPLGEFNVDTYMGSLYMDFGVFCYPVQILMGIAIGYLYVNSRKKGGYWAVFMAFYSYPLFMSFYGWQYSLTTYVYILICFFIIKMINRVRFCISARVSVPERT